MDRDRAHPADHSERGLTVAANIADALVSEGITAVAGLAAGIDAAVHRAALDAGGRTVAVIGTGINKYYSATNRDLQDEISERGLLLSQFWPDAPPQKHTFLMRNATMSGYGLATVVVEAGEKSGTRVQARMAVEHGRTVILTESVYAQNEWARNHLSTRGLITADRVGILAYAVENHQSHWVMRDYKAPTPVREHLIVSELAGDLLEAPLLATRSSYRSTLFKITTRPDVRGPAETARNTDHPAPS